MLKSIKDNTQAYGIFIHSFVMLSFPFLDATAKVLMQNNYHLLQVASGRYFIQTLFILGLIFYYKDSLKNAFKTYIFPKTIIGLANIGLTLGFYGALVYTSVSIALAILFMAPLTTVLLSTVILKERITIKHLSACVIGFIGTIVIIRPGTEDFNTGALFALIAAFSWSTIMIVSRIYATQISPRETQLFSGVLSTIFYIIIMATFTNNLQNFPTDLYFWKYIIVIGILSGVFYTLVQIAHTYTSASTLAPLQYLEMVSGLFLDFILFQIIPDTTTWIGINLVILSGFIVWHTNRQKN